MFVSVSGADWSSMSDASVSFGKLASQLSQTAGRTARCSIRSSWGAGAHGSCSFHLGISSLRKHVKEEVGTSEAQ